MSIGRKPVTKPTAEKTAGAPAASCNVPQCVRTPTTRGLCDAHWATRRGLANPKETPSV